MAMRHPAAEAACDGYTIHPGDRGGSVAVCSCGWRSPGMLSAGVAGARWDLHVEGEDPPTDIR
jgi:hypothetical protein